MADLLPDIPSDLWNSWSADQFAQAAQEKISGLPGDIATGAQNLLAPPAPQNSQPIEPEPVQEPADAVTPPAPLPPPPPPPEPPAPPPAPEPQPSSPPLPTPESAPLPDLSAPPDTAPAPTDILAPTSDLSTPAAPAPQPTTVSPPSPQPSSSGNWDIGALLGAADSAGADMQQFVGTLNQHLQSSGGDMLSSALGAADAAGADMQQFAGKVGDLVPAATQAVSQGAQQAVGAAGSQFSQFDPLIEKYAGDLASDPNFVRSVTAGAKAESNLDPNAVQKGGGGRGLFQFDLGGMGKGLTDAQLFDPEYQASKIVPLYADAYRKGQQMGLQGADLASYAAGMAERPFDYQNPLSTARQNYAKAYTDLGDGVGNVLSGAKQAVQNAASDGVQAVNTVGDAAQSAAARTSQFGMGLSSGDAMAFCGPAAAMAFASTFGRNPTVDEAKQLAQQVGWNPDQGMAGPSSEVSLLNKLGIATHMTNGVDWSQVAKDASAGNPVIIDTPGHYYYVQGYNADTGQFNLGTSATDLKAAKGQSWFTPDQMNNLGMGAARAAIFADHPLSGAGAALQQGANGAVGAITDFTGAASQKAQDVMSAVMDTGTDTLQNAVSTAGNAASALGDTLSQSQLARNLTGTNPDQDTLNQQFDQAQQAAQQQTGSGVSIPSNPLDLLSSMSPWGVGASGEELNTQRNQMIAQNNPLRDVPFVGGASTLAAQTALDPTNLLLAGGPELGRASVALLSDPAVQAALRYRMGGEADVNFALGGIPAALGLGGEGAQSLEASLPEHAGNAARAVYNAAVQGNTAPGTGAGMLSRALDSLAAYPDEVADPIRSFAAASDAPASDVANTIQRWILDNPTHTVPDPITGPSALARDAGQQAVRDIADVVNTGRGNISQFPAGSIPDMLAQGSTADQVLQELLDNLTGKATPKPSVPSAAGYLPPGTMPGQMDLGLGTPKDLTARLPETGATVVPDWLQQQIERGPQQALPINQGASSLVDELTAGARSSNYPPEQTLGTFQQRLQPGSTPIEDIINELTGSTSSGAGGALPRGVTPDMAQAAHTYIDSLPNNGRLTADSTPHLDLNNLLAQPGVTPDAVERFFGQLEGRSATTFADLIRQLRTGSMAGGLGTELKVLASPVINTAMRAPAGALKLIMQGRASDIPDGLVGGFAGLGAGAEEAMQTLRYGTNWRNVMTRADGGGYGFSPGLDVMGTNNFQKALGTALMGLVRTHGAVGDISAGIGRGANAALGATPEAAQEAGQEWALRSGNYGATGQAVARMLGQLRGQNPATNVLGQIIMPFYRIAYNTVTGGIERSPVGFAGRAIDAMQGKPLDQAKLANNLFGTGLFALALKEAGDGNITGDNPQGGAPKQSIQLPGVGYVPLRFMGMAAEPLAQAASIYEASRDNNGDVEGMAKQAASSYLGHVMDESWVGDMSNALGLLDDLKNAGNPGSRQAALAQKDLEYQVSQLGKSFIPQEKLGEQALGLLQGAQSRGTTTAPTGRPTTLTTRPSTSATDTSTRPTTRAAR